MLMPPSFPCASRAARKHQRCPHALLCCQPNPSSAFHLRSLLSGSVMSTGQASEGMLKLCQPELGASTLIFGIYFGFFDRSAKNN